MNHAYEKLHKAESINPSTSVRLIGASFVDVSPWSVFIQLDSRFRSKETYFQEWSRTITSGSSRIDSASSLDPARPTS